MELRILSGLHRGAVMELDDDASEMTLGASADEGVDVLLADAGIAGVHCRLSRHDGHWHIEAVEGSVLGNGGRPLVGQVPVGRGQVLCVGPVRVGFFHRDDPWTETAPTEQASTVGPASPGRFAYPRVRLPVIGVALGVLTLATGIWLIMATWGGRAVAAAARPSSASAVASQAAMASRPQTPRDLADDFTAALAERELKDRLQLDLRPDGWEIRGSLDADEQQRLERLLLRFAETSKPGFPIHVNLVAPADLLPFKVVEVVTGRDAAIVTDDGKRLQVGDAYQGWRLASVSNGTVVFTGRQRVEISL